MIFWKRGRNVAWDVTLSIHLQLFIFRLLRLKLGLHLNGAAQLTIIAKYDEIALGHIFVPPVCEVIDVWPVA